MGGGITGTAAADLIALGADKNEVERLKRPEADKGNAFEVEPENWDAVRAFNAMLTQWHVHPVAAGQKLLMVRTGLDYGALGPVLALLRIENTPALLDRLRVMESDALTIYARRQA